MRKGEKLVNHLTIKFPILDAIDKQYRDSRLLDIIYNMTDDEFNKIIYGENYIEGFEIGAGT